MIRNWIEMNPILLPLSHRTLQLLPYITSSIRKRCINMNLHNYFIEINRNMLWYWLHFWMIVLKSCRKILYHISSDRNFIMFSAKQIPSSNKFSVLNVAHKEFDETHWSTFDDLSQKSHPNLCSSESQLIEVNQQLDKSAIDDKT